MVDPPAITDPQHAIDAVLDLLIKRAQLQDESLERGRRAADSSGLRLDQTLNRLGLVTEDAMLAAWSEVTGLGVVDGDRIPADIPLVDQLGAQFLVHARCLPIQVSDGSLSLAIGDPLDSFSPNAIAAKTGLNVAPVLVKQAVLDLALGRVGAANSPSTADWAIDDDPADDVDRLRDLASDAPVVRLVNSVIDRAVELKASDVHINATLHGPQLRFRIDGVLQEQEPPPHGLLQAVISRLKIMASLDIAERRLPQDGRIRVASHGRELDLRIATIPHAHGEGAVLRLLDRSAVRLDFDALGLSPEVQDALTAALRAPHGMILVTGPTGSGKTTTLYAALSQLRSPERNIVTVEDPIEYHLDGVNQVPVSRKIGFDFAAALRAVLRHDPDVVMVGEIRDAETASIATQAALTGHLVLATVHANTAAAALPRLLDLGVEPFLLTATVRGALAQRLARRLCAVCRKVAQGGTGYEATGCPTCGQTGFHGRIAVSEFLSVTDAIREVISKGGGERDIERAARPDGFSTLREDGERLVRRGITTAGELARVAGGA